MHSIYIDEWIMNNRENRYRFTLAHELGHSVLHIALYQQAAFSTIEQWISVLDSIDSDQYSWFERQAYDFAGLILVPPDQLLSEYRTAVAKLESQNYQFKKANIEMINEYISIDIAKTFAVSEEVAAKRISFDHLTPNAV